MLRHTIASVALLCLVVGAARAGPVDINLGDASSFAVLGGSTVTNTGTTLINGNAGVWPGTSVTGFSSVTVTGGSVHDSDQLAQQAEAALGNAITFAAGETRTSNLTGQDLGGLTLTAGVYNFASAASLTGTLTLNGQGNPNAVFIFQIGSALTTASASMINVINDAEGSNVFWEIGSSATLGTGSIFDGSILANTSISLNTGADIACGRALALTGAVTLQANTVASGGSACNGSSVAVPEPSSAGLLAASLALMIGTGLLMQSKQGIPSSGQVLPV